MAAEVVVAQEVWKDYAGRWRYWYETRTPAGMRHTYRSGLYPTKADAEEALADAVEGRT